jgi:ribosomal protein S14
MAYVESPKDRQVQSCKQGERLESLRRKLKLCLICLSPEIFGRI